MKTTKQFFLELISNLNDISSTIEWDEVRNGTGYFDGLMKRKSPEGTLETATCPDTKRRMLLVGHGKTSSVIFERFTPNETSFVLVGNVDSLAQKVIGYYNEWNETSINLLINYRIVDTTGFTIEEMRNHELKVNKQRLVYLKETGDYSQESLDRELIWREESINKKYADKLSEI